VEVATGVYTERLANIIPSGTSWKTPFTLRSSTKRGAIVRVTSNLSAIQNDPNTFHHIRIINNEIKNIPGDGICGSLASSEVTYNSIHDGGYVAPGYSHGMYMGAGTIGSLIEKNEIFNYKGYGLHLYDGGKGQIQNNVIRYNSNHHNGGASYGTGAILVWGPYNQIYRNVSHNNFGSGFEIQWQGNVLYNNVAYGNREYGIYQRSGTGNVYKNNIARNNTSSIKIGGGSATVSNNICSQNDNGCTLIDPLFEDAANANFNLKPGSPAIGAGTCSITAQIAIGSGGSCNVGAY
jgi:parallel beta-helix repeat protein